MPAEPFDFALQPVVFTHIPKTAGTTVIFGLRRAFNGRGAFRVQRHNDQELAALAADQALCIYTGHVPYARMLAAFAASARRPLFVTVLRDPIDRILSAYSYAREKPLQQWHDLATSHDINAFVAAMKKKEPQFLVGKQCRFVCPLGSLKAESAFASVKENFALVGLQNDLEAFFLGLETLIGHPLARPKARNQTANRVTREDLSPKTLTILEKTTEQDRRLYDLTMDWLTR
jgi:hypothetical protein